jgi:hypothetical protein
VLVAVLVTLIAALATPAPDGLVIFPESVPLTDWAPARAAVSSRIHNTYKGVLRIEPFLTKPPKSRVTTPSKIGQWTFGVAENITENKNRSVVNRLANAQPAVGESRR